MNESAVPPDPGPRNKSLHLSSDQLEQIAAGESTNTHANCVDHLDSCEYCRQQLAKVAADELFWRKSADLLQSRDPPEELCSTTDEDLDVLQAPADEAITNKMCLIVA